jgi:hypothetical protein
MLHGCEKFSLFCTSYVRLLPLFHDSFWKYAVPFVDSWMSASMYCSSQQNNIIPDKYTSTTQRIDSEVYSTIVDALLVFVAFLWNFFISGLCRTVLKYNSYLKISNASQCFVRQVFIPFIISLLIFSNFLNSTRPFREMLCTYKRTFKFFLYSKVLASAYNLHISNDKENICSKFLSIYKKC